MRLLEPALLAGARRSSRGGKLDPLDFGESGGRPLGRVGVDFGRPRSRGASSETMNRLRETKASWSNDARPMEIEVNTEPAGIKHLPALLRWTAPDSTLPTC